MTAQHEGMPTRDSDTDYRQLQEADSQRTPNIEGRRVDDVPREAEPSKAGLHMPKRG